MPPKKKPRAALPRAASGGMTPRTAALAVQFGKKLKKRRAARHGATEAESAQLHAGLEEFSDLDLPLELEEFDEQPEAEEAAAAAAAMEMGMGAMSPLADDDEGVRAAGRVAASAANVGIGAGIRAVQFGAKLLQRREKQTGRATEAKMDEALRIGLGQLDNLAILQRALPIELSPFRSALEQPQPQPQPSQPPQRASPRGHSGRRATWPLFQTVLMRVLGLSW
jgi:hypothetical protein